MIFFCMVKCKINNGCPIPGNRSTEHFIIAITFITALRHHVNEQSGMLLRATITAEARKITAVLQSAKLGVSSKQCSFVEKNGIMKVAVIADEQARQWFLGMKPPPPATSVCFVDLCEAVPADSDIVIDLLFKNQPERVSLLHSFLPRAVLINAVADT